MKASVLALSLFLARTLAFPQRGVQIPFGTATGGGDTSRYVSTFPLDVQQATNNACPQFEPLHPTKHAEFYSSIKVVYSTESFKNRAIQALSGAVKIPTESFDVMGPVGLDPRWEVFGQLHDYFQETFPLIHSKLKVTKVNTYGIVVHWQGSDNTLKPILLAGHQDVVPVEPSTVGQWEHPPYSGYYDGTWIWGRGSCDDKASVNSILLTVESLLEKGFRPTRTLVLGFGFDEESAGSEGAGRIAAYLEETYGRDSFAAILDEGSGFAQSSGGDMIFAVPSTSEKGYIDVKIQVSTLGGHSSVPPPHTAIGILSSLIVAIEKEQHAPSLSRTGTSFAFFQCAAAYVPDYPESLRKLARKATTDDDALKKLVQVISELDPVFSSMLRTTQAVDMISGGVKVNALPEEVYAVVNHRIGEHSSVAEVQNHITSVLLPVANLFNLTVTAFGTNLTTSTVEPVGHLTLSDAFGTALEPAPPTPVGYSDPWKLLSGTIKAALNNSRKYGGKKVAVSPLLALGNTDTKFYWNLTKHIFRYGHLGSTDAYNGAHTVNEALRADAIVDQVEFLTMFILNWDESKL